MKTVAMTAFTGGGGTSNNPLKGFCQLIKDLLKFDQNNDIITNIVCIEFEKEDNVKKDLKKTVFTHACHCVMQPDVAIPSNKTKSAFTLAEVLITLGIIGIVVAMTLPTLIANHQKKVTATRLKQTYSQLSQALNSAQVEYGDVKNWDVMQYVPVDSSNPNQKRDLITRFVDTYMEPHLKLVSKSRYAMFKELGYKDGYIYKDGTVYMNSSTKLYISELSNGVTLIWLYNGNSSTLTCPIVLVDINGKAKPNMLGRDFFMFSFIADKPVVIQPAGQGRLRPALVNDCKKGAAGNGVNFSCTGLIMLDGWEIKKDHPW